MGTSVTQLTLRLRNGLPKLPVFQLITIFLCWPGLNFRAWMGASVIEEDATQAEGTSGSRTWWVEEV